MTTCDASEVESTSFRARDLIARRARPQIILLDAEYNVLVAEWDTGSHLFRELGLEARYANRLLPSIEAAVREVVQALNEDPLSETTIDIGGTLSIRVGVLGGGGGHIALYVEPNRRREDLKAAAKRFRLTQRQIEVLGYVLQGQSAREIAETLSISETTVGDYFKQLLGRTNARNRADMVARVMNWNDGERARTPAK